MALNCINLGNTMVLTSTQLQFQKLISHYNSYCVKTKSNRNVDLLQIILSIADTIGDIEIVQENESLFVQIK